MHICLLTADGTKGGIEKHILDLSAELAKENKVTVIGPRELTTQLSRNVHSIPFNWNLSRYNPILLWRLFKEVKNLSPNILHTHGGKATFCIAKLIFFLRSTFISTLHNARIHKAKPYIYTDLTICVSSIVQSAAKKVGCYETVVIHNGIEVPQRYRNIRQELLYNFRDHQLPLLCGVGRLVTPKGFDRLLEISHKINANILILGEGPQRTHLEKIIAEKNIAHKCVLLGYKDNVTQVLQSVDGCVITSRAEGFSYVALEALLSNTCVASTNVACSEFLPTYTILPDAPDLMANKLNLLINNKKKWEDEMYTSFENALKNLTLQTMAAKTQSVYKSLGGREN